MATVAKREFISFNCGRIKRNVAFEIIFVAFLIMDAVGRNNTSSEWEFISCHTFSFHLGASLDVSAEASPIFHSHVFTFVQRHLSTNLSHRALGVTSRDKFPREKETLIFCLIYHSNCGSEYEGSVSLYVIFVPLLLIHVCTKHT